MVIYLYFNLYLYLNILQPELFECDTRTGHYPLSDYHFLKMLHFEDFLSIISVRLVHCDGPNRSSFIILNYIMLPDDGSKKYFNTRNKMMEEVQYLCQYNVLLSQTLRFLTLHLLFLLLLLLLLH